MGEWGQVTLFRTDDLDALESDIYELPECFCRVRPGNHLHGSAGLQGRHALAGGGLPMTPTFPSLRIHDSRDRVVLRDGLLFCFFMRRSHGDVSEGLWRAVQTYRSARPARALAWYAMPDGEWAPLDDAGWESVRGEILETRWPTGSEVRLQESHTEVCAHGFEYTGKWLDAPTWQGQEEVVSAAAFTLPTDFLVEHGSGHVRSLALALAAELPWRFGYVSPAFIRGAG